jgi:ribonucleoside-diphosphate reductase alpha chain
MDAIDRANPLPALGGIEATNPVRRGSLLPYESCVLGSVNLAHMVRPGPPPDIAWDLSERWSGAESGSWTM